jgi:UDP-N-acetyl-D-galactosamine dehydrogenase
MSKIIGVIGVGYVGLPLAIKFSNYYKVIGYDHNKKRILELLKFYDVNQEHLKKEFKKKNLNFTNNFNLLKKCNFFIITLPTPLNKRHSPDLNAVVQLCKNLGKILKRNDTVIFESTVYPGATEELFLPNLEKKSKLKVNKDFFLGYSPERINPGDKIHTIEKIKKIVSGSNQKSLSIVESLYKKIIKAGVYRVSSIKVAELSKVLENTQRFVNIALINEISILCNKLQIQTKEVIDAASSKWNFMKFYPGLVGGHCISVDPLYLSYKSEFYKLKPDIINTSHKINNNVANFIINNFNKLVNKKKPKVLILGATFKENCSDLRNSGVIKIIQLLNKMQIKPTVVDPYVNTDPKLEIKYNFIFEKMYKKNFYDVVIILVAHDIFKKMGIQKIKMLANNKNCIIMDIKSIFPKDEVDFQL